MSEKDFFREQAKRRTARSVKAVEALTSAEVVVAVRRRSGDYRVGAYHFGIAVAGLVVGYLLVAPQVFSVGAIALDGCAAFLASLVVARNIEPVGRCLVRRSRRRASIETAARAAFYELGISKTSGRNGVLVFVSTFERDVVVLPDIGIDVEALGAPWTGACAGLERAVRQRDLSAFLLALESLGPILGERMPRMANDVNELDDEVQ